MKKVQGMLNGIRVNSLDATIEIVQANNDYKNDYEKASAFILATIGRHHEKNARTGRARNVSATTTKPNHNTWTPGKADKGQPWMNKDGVFDFRGVKNGKYDRFLGNFNYKEGYFDKEWKALHPMFIRVV